MKYSCSACGRYVEAGGGHSCYSPSPQLDVGVSQKQALRIAELETENEAWREAARAMVEWSVDNFDIDQCTEFDVLAALLGVQK